MGIDEAGRGPIAGPVAVGAVWYDASQPHVRRILKKHFPIVKDSKQLSEKKREALFEILNALCEDNVLGYSVALVSSTTIDQKGISYAIKEGILSVLKQSSLHANHISLLLDGGLRASAEYRYQTTYIKGDATHLPIALASIVAKVTRDRHMRKVAQRHPQYGFDIHKGYGTQAHYSAIKQHGISPLHRKTFIT